jgi:HEAT repeat protein
MNALAAIPKNDQSIEKILLTKGSGKYERLRSLGPQAYWDLKALAFNEEKNLQYRWAAMVAMARLGEQHSLPELKQALKHRDWFMRDVSLRLLPAVDKKEASEAAVRALKDSALVVRTTAVDSIKSLKVSKASDQLWKMLYAKDNYMKKQSLWIRRHIVEALAEIAPAGSEAQFIKVFDDSDSSLYEPAIKGLERLSGKKLGNAREPANFRRYQWQKWWASRAS